MRIELLADHLSAVPVIAGWHFEEWSSMYPGTTVTAWAAELAGRCERDRIPTTFVAVVDSAPVGSASLVECDMETRPDLSPWLAAVYVLPAWRQRGIGRALVTHAVARAQEFGIGRLYLWTDTAAAMYEALGWRARCEEPYKGRVMLVMVGTWASNRHCTALERGLAGLQGYRRTIMADEVTIDTGSLAWVASKWPGVSIKITEGKGVTWEGEEHAAQ